MKNQHIQTLLAHWAEPGVRLGQGYLIDASGCMCAQGYALHHCGGWEPQRLRHTSQDEADKATAELLGISRAHAVLLRIVNDAGGSPSDVLARPDLVLGSQARAVLAFWRHLDTLTAAEWDAARSAERAVAGSQAWYEAGKAARNAAYSVAGRDSCPALGIPAAVAVRATWEIQGAELLRQQGGEFYFLPMFGFANPEAVLAKT
jgi:hypothetical protein